MSTVPLRHVGGALRLGIVPATLALAALLGAAGAVAQSPAVAAAPASAPAPAAPGVAAQAPAAATAAVATDKISLELNKLEALANGCRAYLVVENKSERAYAALKLDLVMFQTDGVIGRRFALELAPVKPAKTSVKLFDLDGVKCDDIASLLVNDVMDCKAGAGDEAGCIDRLALGSRAKAQLSK